MTPGASGSGAIETTAALVHLRRPSRLSTLTLPDTQPFDDPAGRYAFSHNGDLRDYRSLRATFRAQGRIHGRADTEVGARWLEDAWDQGETVPDPARGAARPVWRRGQPRGPPGRRRHLSLRRATARTRSSRSGWAGSASRRPGSIRWIAPFSATRRRARPIDGSSEWARPCASMLAGSPPPRRRMAARSPAGRRRR